MNIHESSVFYFSELENEFALKLIYTNLLLFVFNLFPIYPLDGFNFINTFLKYDNKFANFMIKYGNLLLIVLLLTGFFSYIFNWVIFYI